MKYPLYIMAAGLAWTNFVSALQADPPASIDLVSIKLADKNQVTVAAEVRNLSNEDIRIDPQISFRLANLKGEYYQKTPENDMEPGTYSARLVLFYDLAIPQNGSAFITLNFQGAESQYRTYLVLKPGQKNDISLLIPNIDEMLTVNSDIVPKVNLTTAMSKDLWARCVLYQSGGEPTQEEEQRLVKLSQNSFAREEYKRLKKELADKYAPRKVAQSNLYKFKAPMEGESNIKLEPIKDSF
jgi:hypothetical protein